MARKASRAETISALAHPEDRRDAARRARAEVRFDEQATLGTLFGEFDANLVQIENRLGFVLPVLDWDVRAAGPPEGA